jgi:hypothetical protein
MRQKMTQGGDRDIETRKDNSLQTMMQWGDWDIETRKNTTICH